MDKYKIRRMLTSCAFVTTIGISGVYMINNSFDVIAPSISASPKYVYDVHTIKSDTEKVSIDTKVQTTPTESTKISDSYNISLNECEIYTLATLVHLEAGIECYDCQKDIASVVINRMLIDNLTLDEVIYAPNQFSPAYMISYSEPTEKSLNAVKEVLTEGTTLPIYVTYFRADRYHQWDGLVGYIQYENTYFSYDANLKRKYENGEI